MAANNLSLTGQPGIRRFDVQVDKTARLVSFLYSSCSWDEPSFQHREHDGTVRTVRNARRWLHSLRLHQWACRIQISHRTQVRCPWNWLALQATSAIPEYARAQPPTFIALQCAQPFIGLDTGLKLKPREARFGDRLAARAVAEGGK